MFGTTKRQLMAMESQLARLQTSAAQNPVKTQRDLTVNLKLEGKDAFVREVAEVTQALQETNKAFAAIDQALADATKRVTELDITMATPRQIMEQQLKQLRKMSAVDAIRPETAVMLSRAMVDVYQALDAYDLELEVTEEECETEDEKRDA